MLTILYIPLVVITLLIYEFSTIFLRRLVLSLEYFREEKSPFELKSILLYPILYIYNIFNIIASYLVPFILLISSLIIENIWGMNVNTLWEMIILGAFIIIITYRSMVSMMYGNPIPIFYGIPQKNERTFEKF